MRFGTDPRTSALDLQCRMHDLHNLYVAAVTLFGTALLRLAGLRVDWLVVALVGWLLVGGLAAGGLHPPFGVLNLLVMYAVTDVAAVCHLRRTGAGRGAQVLPLVVAVVVFVHSIRSVPRGLLLVLAGWLALAAVFALVGRPRAHTA